jgi:hypothetical protein
MRCAHGYREGTRSVRKCVYCKQLVVKIKQGKVKHFKWFTGRIKRQILSIH